MDVMRFSRDLNLVRGNKGYILMLILKYEGKNIGTHINKGISTFLPQTNQNQKSANRKVNKNKLNKNKSCFTSFR